jgi:hypothetical protein
MAKEKDCSLTISNTDAFAHTALLFPSHRQTNDSLDRSNNPEFITDENDDNDNIFHGSWETEFGEGMKSILDIVHPDLTCPEKGEKLPTLLFPWRGGGNTGTLINNRRSNVSSSSRGLYDGRQ